jgi:predicted alpha/beta superfamily hydrolase
MNRFFLVVFVLCCCNAFVIAQSPIPKVVKGKIDRIENFQSKYTASRKIDIWLPQDYCDTIKYDVLYMQDGQMLFDPEIAWNKQSWNIDDVATQLLSSNEFKKFIVVGIWNSGSTRHSDYFPQKPFEQLLQIEKDTISAQLKRAGRIQVKFKPQSNNYLKFIVKELKPFIDNRYSVNTNKENTFIAGSSMGGLISMYAICQYPQIFGGAACLSTHWVGTFSAENNPIPNSFIKYLGKNLPNPKNHKIYFDCGDQTLDALYPKIQKMVDSVLFSKGFTDGNWITKFFPGENHSETSWNKRLHIPLQFLFNKK